MIESQKTGLSRRGLFAWTGAAGAAGLAIGAGAGVLGAPALSRGDGKSSGEDLEYPFYGEVQAGIVTPAQDQMHFAAFDMMDGESRDDLVELLQDWTYAASRLVMGLDVVASGAFDGDPLAPPGDTGEAADHGPFGLTITFGFGRSLFLADDGADRFGLGGQLPEEFQPLPKMVNDFVNPAISHGDLCIQACANDPQVAVHAIRNLTRLAFGRARLRWSQLGFGRTSSTSTAQQTPRNLFGQKDGTNNLKAEEPEKLDQHVWIDSGPEWTHGGSYLVARKIAMTIEVWDGVRLEEQDRVLGRAKGTGAPLSGGDEFTAPDFAATGDHGKPLIDERSHVARTHPDNNDGIHMLRRGYNYVDGNDQTGRLAAGLFFIAYLKSPDRFAQVHKNMARDDMFVEYLKTQSTAVFLVPPGIAEGGYVGQALFEA
jgi:deferrochelatase/peroxidase EfeB